MPIDLLDQPVRRVAVAVLDLELTGLDAENDQICEVAIVRCGEELEEYQTLVKPTAPMSPGARKVHRISDEMLADAPPFAKVASKIKQLVDDAVVVCHNVAFDLCFLHRAFEDAGLELLPPVTLDTLLMSRRLFAFPRNDLASACAKMKIEFQGAHRALADARVTYQLLNRILEIVDPEERVTVQELSDLVGALAPNSPLRLRQQQTVRDALRRRKTIWIDYQATSDPTVGLIHREVGVWHIKLPRMQGWCYLREGERVFRLDRIRKVWPGVRPYDIPEFRRRI
ncbi:MAG: hypothetical protein HN348_04115 [Proteobacteria bacterium]|nr:hypothetical protein [Pseudomonadota bacterium]